MIQAKFALLSERLGYVLSRDGASATTWWLLKKIAHIDAYHVLAFPSKKKSLKHEGRQCRFSFSSIATSEDIELLQVSLRVELEKHSNRDLRMLVSENATIYFLADGDQLVSQLVISRCSEIRVDVPPGLIFDIGPKTRFLSYLFTHLKYRRIGAAQELLEVVCEELDRTDCERVIAHVLVTNVPSLGAFAAAGWRRLGTVLKTARGDSWSAIGLGKHGIGIRYVAGDLGTRQ